MGDATGSVAERSIVFPSCARYYKSVIVSFKYICILILCGLGSVVLANQTNITNQFVSFIYVYSWLPCSGWPWKCSAWQADRNCKSVTVSFKYVYIPGCLVLGSLGSVVHGKQTDIANQFLQSVSNTSVFLAALFCAAFRVEWQVNFCSVSLSGETLFSYCDDCSMPAV